jgi:hypothetical protein
MLFDILSTIEATASGAIAVPVAWIAARNGGRARNLVLVWNAIGFLDLVLGATSAPGPLRVFMDPPSSAIMTTVPWIIIPCFLVPSFEAIHIAIFYRLSRMAGRVGSQLGKEASPSAAC